MSRLLSYKNYNGTVEFSSDDNCLFGKVVGIKSLLSYEGQSIKELKEDFERTVDEYRISPDLHRNIAVYAIEHGKTLNAAVEEAIRNMIGMAPAQKSIL